MRAASSPATTMPRMPVGRTSRTISGNAACAADGTTWPVAGSTRTRQARALAGLGQRQGDHAGDDEDEDGQQLEAGGEDGAAPGLRLVGRAERALDDVLVRAPVPEADDRRAEEHAQPRVVAVEVPGDAAGFLHRLPRPFDAGRHQRLPQVEHLRPEHGPQLAPAAEDVETVDGQHAASRSRGSASGSLRCRRPRASRRAPCRRRSGRRPAPTRSRSCSARCCRARGASRAAARRTRRRPRRCRPRSW